MRIEAFQETVLREVLTKLEDLNATFWRLHIDCYFANNTNGRIHGRIDLNVDNYPKGIFTITLVPNVYGEIVWSTFIDFNKVNIAT